ncbi:MAG: hypothetical protein LBT40_03235, partial [Deltaproteobacteria bacterium]|nr:hypothetical protein [Deltaproteobacteria bacterium]
MLFLFMRLAGSFVRLCIWRPGLGRPGPGKVRAWKGQDYQERQASGKATAIWKGRDLERPGPSGKDGTWRGRGRQERTGPGEAGAVRKGRDLERPGPSGKDGT